jgi:LmbE family N-acetylglucosaminyl deacetylase
VHYDPTGIYRHPDHLAVHRIGAEAATLAGVTGYEATVPRDGRRVGRRAHLVDVAAAGGAVGWDSAGIATEVRADAADLAAKRAAMAAHASQVPRSATRRTGFADTYGREWYRRAGVPGLLDEVATRGWAEPLRRPRRHPGTRGVAPALDG